MQSRFIRYGAFLLAVFIAISVCSIDADAQRRRKRRVRRVKKPVPVRPVITNPAIAPSGSEQSGGETERIISTADQSVSDIEQTTEGTQPKKTNSSAKGSSDADMQQTINSLSNQVDRLNDKLTQLQQNDRTRIDMERLTRAEQRAESLRAQQIDVESKLADLQSRLELIDYQLRPENIEQAAGYGTVHPEEARAARKRQLENERTRVLSQIKILETSRTRLETSVTAADAEVDSLRRKIEMQQAQQDSSGKTNEEPRRPE